MRSIFYKIYALCVISIFFLGTNTVAETLEGHMSIAQGEIKVARVEEKTFQVGMSREELFRIFSETDLRTYRVYNSEETLTFNYSPETPGFITFFLINDKVKLWKINFRSEAVTSYLSEFCSQYFIENAPIVYEALSEVLRKIPQEVFLRLTDRKYPAVFTEQNNTGSGRIACSSEIIVLEDDPPTFTDGLCIVKLGTELSRAESPEEIEGVIAHELAHRYLNHGAIDKYSLKMEKKADELAISWGFEAELLKSREKFGGEYDH